MFCPECGRALPVDPARFCPFCGKRIVLPQQAQPAEGPAPIPNPEPALIPKPEPAPVTMSKRCTAALLLGTGTCVCGMLTVICRMLGTDLRLLGTVAAGTFFLAPLACVFGLFGILVRIKNPNRRGLFRAIAGLVLGLVFGAVAAYCVLRRILFY